MDDELYVILPEDGEPIPPEDLQEEPEAEIEAVKMDAPLKIKLRNRSKSILCANLNGVDKKGRKRAVIWGPLGLDDERDLDPMDMECKEIRKLLKMNKLEIRR